MAISYMNTAQSGALSDRYELEDNSCGWDVDWSKGLSGLPREPSRSPDISGALLTKVIEGEIIPRLFLAHQKLRSVPSAPEPVENPIPIGDSESFARLVLISEPQEIVEQVQALLDRGVKLERIYLDLLAPVARMLGVFWEEDRCTFTDVTLGLSRLHQVLHEIGQRMEGNPKPSKRRRAYFVPTPGEQHTFGLSMLEEFFLHAGWETSADHDASIEMILETVAAHEFDVIGFSVGCKEFFDPLSAIIKRTREASRNRNVVIMAGGKVFLDHPELAAKLDSAVVAYDGVQAVQLAEKHVSRSVVANRTLF